MNPIFGSDFFAGNRARLKQLFTGTAPVVIPANGLLQRGGDSTYAFSQDANFWYLTGIDEPDIVLVMDRDSEYLIAPEREAVRQTFDGGVDNRVLSATSGIEQVLDGREGWEKLSSRLKKVKHVAVIAAPPAYVDRLGMYTNPAKAAVNQKLTEINPQLQLLDLSQHLVKLRMVKQRPEIAAIQAAINITVNSIKETVRPSKLAHYKYEYMVEAELTRGYRRRGASGHAFEPVIASGQRACTLHNVANDSKIEPGELLLIDTGAEYGHYAADITRTYMPNGALNKRQQAVYQAVMDVQSFAISRLGPGVNLHEYELEVENYMGEKLRELGLIKTINQENVRQYYPHATSHFLGLNVHDPGDYSRLLEPGMVLTVEPGIYIPEESIGIRIEDDVLIGKNGIKNLSSKLPVNIS